MHRSTCGKKPGASEPSRDANRPRAYYRNRPKPPARIGSLSAWPMFLLCCTLLVPTESCTSPGMGSKSVHPEHGPAASEIGNLGSGEWFYACVLPRLGPDNERAVAGIMTPRTGSPSVCVVVAVWKDGRIAWSDAPGGGPPYYAGKIAPAKLEDLLGAWESAGDLDELVLGGVLLICVPGPEIIVADGGRRLYLETVHLFGKIATGSTPDPEAVRFDELWARTRDGLLSLIPKEGGQPAHLTFDGTACRDRLNPEAARRRREEIAAFAEKLGLDIEDFDFEADDAVADDLKDLP